MDKQRNDIPMSHQLHSWARRQRSAAIRDACRRAMVAMWRFLIGRERRRDPDERAGLARSRMGQ